jgi:dienelactone hydrolase
VLHAPRRVRSATAPGCPASMACVRAGFRGYPFRTPVPRAGASLPREPGRTPKMSPRSPLLALLVGLAATAAQAQVPPRAVAFETEDGLTLQGTIYAANRTGPGILLLNMCQGDRTAWDSVATGLAERGFHVLTFDYRGMGASEGPPPAFGSFENAMRIWSTTWKPDVEAAYRLLLAQPGVRAEASGVGGASCGVHLALQLARTHPEVRTAVLLAGPAGAAEQAYVAASAGLPLFGAASAEDHGADAMRGLIGRSPHPESRFALYQAAGHGTQMLARVPALRGLLLDWFVQHLGTPP